MKWERVSDTQKQSDEGYIVRAFKQFGGGYRFCAWMPPESYQAFKQRLKTRYEIGEGVPEPDKHLGCYDCAADAVAACEREAEAIKSEAAR